MMNFKKYFELFLEMDNAMEFLQNPEHSDKTFPELVKEFEASGGKMVGSGCYGSAYIHPKWNYALKTFTLDDCYLSYARLASRINSTAVPRFLGTPKQIVPHYTRAQNQRKIYIVRMEKLNRVDRLAYRQMMDMIRKINFYGDSGDPEPQTVKVREYIEDHKNDLSQNQIDFLNLYNTLLIKQTDMRAYKCGLDMHDGNVMQRDNGELVITDPYAERGWSEGAEGAEGRSKFRSNLRYGKLNGTIPGGKLKPVKPPTQPQQPLGPPNLNI